MEEKKDKNVNSQESENNVTRTEPDADWPHQTIQDLEDFIESQGIYIRQ